ncbi:MAG: OmpA family protein [Elusimicrobia bacterium]|nr:OmpA family protein [Elusimicrobiota bacterium]
MSPKTSSVGAVLALAQALGLCLCVLAADAFGQERALSRQMKLGIMFYERGEDGQAMDRFMDVLTRGEASERPLANEYINLITQRLNTGAPPKDAAPGLPVQLDPVENPGPARAAAPAAPEGHEVVVEPEAPRMVAPEPKSRKRPAVEVKEEEEEAAEEPARVRVSKPGKEAVERDIRAKIRAIYTSNLEKLRAISDVQVALDSAGNPDAIGIPTPVFFQSGIAFKKTAKPLLEALTSIAFSLKNAQILIMPEGAAVGDPKVLDMRRTMGISAHLYTAGISPARVRVNLLSSQVEIPKALRNFKGILLVFVYNKPLDLVMEGEAAHDAGPTVSLGVQPERVDPGRGEGSVIEFSVLEPPAGLASWRFRLLRPSLEEGEDLAPLNDVVGSGPVFHQIYWNGRKNYFGDPMPAGRYECVLTATDGRNRSRTLHRWITLAGAPSPERPSVRSRKPVGEVEAAPAGPPPADLGSGGLDSPESLVKGVTVGKAVSSKRPARARKSRASAKRKLAAAAQDKAEPDAEGQPTAPAGAAAAGAKDFELSFAPDSPELSPEAEAVIDQVGAVLENDKKSTLEITGHAAGAGLEAAALAKKRAGDAADRLMRKYGVPPERIVIRSSASDADKVEIKLTEAAAETP